MWWQLFQDTEQELIGVDHLAFVVRLLDALSSLHEATTKRTPASVTAEKQSPNNRFFISCVNKKLFFRSKAPVL
jgi:hypothetical protein